MNKLLANLVFLTLLMAATALWQDVSLAQTTLDPNWRVSAVDTNKPGFLWNYFSNNGNTANSTIRAESALGGLLTDSAGAPLPNLGDPTVVGAAIGPAAAASPANGVLHFEIAGVINLSKTDGDAKGNFTPDELEPGLNSNESTDGQAAEILTYLKLPVGTIKMGVNSDDGFQTSTGPNPTSPFGRVVVGEYNGGRGASDSIFEFVVTQPGYYPFRTIWENGGGDSNVEWFTESADGTRVLVNDVANGGIPAYRALAAGAVVAPYIQSAVPPPLPRQLEQTGRGVKLSLADGSVGVDDATVTLQVDGKATPVTKQRAGTTLTVDTGVLEGLHLAGEAHTASLAYKDKAGASHTQQWKFYNLENLVLPATPVAGENFDSYPEATSDANAVPPGWVATNYTFKETDGWDLTDITSDAYMGWVVISTNTVFGVEDEVLDNNRLQTINGNSVTNWMSGNLLFAASDGRKDKDENGTRVGQIQIVVSKPFNLSTAANPLLTFSSGVRISGNATEMDAVEYSIDKGTNWLPVIYMQHAVTLKYASDGSYDALATFNTQSTSIPEYPVFGADPKGGKFADYIKAPISQALSPYIANRNDTALSRRVEAIRLPQASKQSDVRLRFMHVGSCGWEWGVDNIAFYDIPGATAEGPNITSVKLAGRTISIQWTGGGALEATPSLSSPTWTSTGNTSGNFSELVPTTGAKFYRVNR